MKKSLRIPSALAVAIAAALAPSKADAAFAYTIQGATTLLRFDTANPGSVTTVGAFTGAATLLDGLDFRPANGLLYGYSQATNTLVTIDPSNAVTSFASTPSTASSDFILGLDFNPAADRLRLVNASDQNLRINVDNGLTLVDGNLAYAVGDPFFGTNPSINEAAYTNNDNNPGTGTQLYYIDVGTNSLVTTSNPNGGVLNTVGALGINANDLIGFDIVTDPFSGTNTAYAILDDNTASRFYTINLATGAATLIGALDAAGEFGLAVVPTAVPEPGTALAGLAAFGLCAVRRRRAARA